MWHTSPEPLSHIFRPQRSGVSRGSRQRSSQWLLQCSWAPSPSSDGKARTCCLPQPQSSPLPLSEGLLLAGEPGHVSVQCRHLPCRGRSCTICFSCHQSGAAKRQGKAIGQGQEPFSASHACTQRHSRASRAGVRLRTAAGHRSHCLVPQTRSDLHKAPRSWWQTARRQLASEIIFKN